MADLLTALEATDLPEGVTFGTCSPLVQNLAATCPEMGLAPMLLDSGYEHYEGIEDLTDLIDPEGVVECENPF